MDKTINLNRILEDLAPRFAADAEWLDVTDGFVGNNYDALREHKVFSALVPQAYGGGGATHAEMCEFV
ncbi:MAG: hypothetical protein GY788_05090, partial [bacterium]|nr:hypothetical protein [bacterium]